MGAARDRRRPGRPARRRGGRPSVHQHRFGLLLLILTVTYVLSAFLSGNWVSALQIVLFLAVTVLAVRAGSIRRRTARALVAVALTGSVPAVAIALTHANDAGAGAAFLWIAAILLMAVVIIVGRVLAQPSVTLQSIYGAVSAYMIIGLMFAAVYGAVYRFSGGTFFAHGSPGNAKTFQYFSFTTLTTLGYGDFTAASAGGQALAVMEALLGQVFLATLVARLVSAFGVSRRSGGGPGPRSPGRARRPAGGRGVSGAGRETARTSAGRVRRAGQARRQPPARDTSLPAHAPPARRSRSRRGR
jgi:ion channel